MIFCVYFLLTLTIELPIVCWFYRKQWKDVLGIGFLLNLFTWPLVQVLVYHTNINVNILEVLVFLTEGLGYWLFLKGKWHRAFLASLLANGASYGIGLLINAWLS